MKNKLPSIPTKAELRGLRKFMSDEVARLNNLKNEDLEKFLKRVKVLVRRGFEVAYSEFTREVMGVSLTTHTW